MSLVERIRSSVKENVDVNFLADQAVKGGLRDTLFYLDKQDPTGERTRAFFKRVVKDIGADETIVDRFEDLNHYSIYPHLEAVFYGIYESKDESLPRYILEASMRMRETSLDFLKLSVNYMIGGGVWEGWGKSIRGYVEALDQNEVYIRLKKISKECRSEVYNSLIRSAEKSNKELVLEVLSFVEKIKHAQILKEFNIFLGDELTTDSYGESARQLVHDFDIPEFHALFSGDFNDRMIKIYEEIDNEYSMVGTQQSLKDKCLELRSGIYSP